MDLFEAEILAKELMSQTIPHYYFSWNNLKTINGRCVYRTRTIELSRHLTTLRTIQAVTLTIKHEMAHALTQGDGHGRLWKSQMRAWGLPAERCSQDVVDKESISNWVAQCPGCGKLSYMIRKPRVVRSCGTCSKVYDERYRLTFRPC